jgi:peptidoglycan/LPS O-acetylase OafA/YrhL
MDSTTVLLPNTPGTAYGGDERVRVRATGTSQASTASHVRYGKIDSLRFFAMAGVIAQHCSLAPFGWAGVWLFFVISGFVVTTSIFDRPRDEPVRQLLSFYGRRLLRIAPAYFAFLCVAAAAFSIFRIPFHGDEWFSLIFYYFNLYRIFHASWTPAFPVDFLWSISTEMQFYTVAGAIIIFSDRGQIGKILLTLALVSVASRVLMTLFHYPVNAWYAARTNSFLFLNQMDAFAAGALLALNRDKLTAKRAWALLFAGVVCLAAYVAVYGSINALILHRTGLRIAANILTGEIIGQFRDAVVYPPLIILFAGLVAVAYSSSAGIVQGLLGTRIVQWAGRTSYSGYLWHSAIIGFVSWLFGNVPQLHLDKSLSSLGPKFLLFVVALAVTVLVSDISYRLIEKAPQDAFKRWQRSRLLSPAQAG